LIGTRGFFESGKARPELLPEEVEKMERGKTEVRSNESRPDGQSIPDIL
jgi:hypothetical protein